MNLVPFNPFEGTRLAHQPEAMESVVERPNIVEQSLSSLAPRPKSQCGLWTARSQLKPGLPQSHVAIDPTHRVVQSSGLGKRTMGIDWDLGRVPSPTTSSASERLRSPRHYRQKCVRKYCHVRVAHSAPSPRDHHRSLRQRTLLSAHFIQALQKEDPPLKSGATSGLLWVPGRLSPKAGPHSL